MAILDSPPRLAWLRRFRCDATAQVRNDLHALARDLALSPNVAKIPGEGGMPLAVVASLCIANSWSSPRPEAAALCRDTCWLGRSQGFCVNAEPDLARRVTLQTRTPARALARWRFSICMAFVTE